MSSSRSDIITQIVREFVCLLFSFTVLGVFLAAMSSSRSFIVIQFVRSFMCLFVCPFVCPFCILLVLLESIVYFLVLESFNGVARKFKGFLKKVSRIVLCCAVLG